MIQVRYSIYSEKFKRVSIHLRISRYFKMIRMGEHTWILKPCHLGTGGAGKRRFSGVSTTPRASAHWARLHGRFMGIRVPRSIEKGGCLVWCALPSDNQTWQLEILD